jgi:hypothetical protein
MKLKHALNVAFAFGLALSVQINLQGADHGHLNAGAVSTKQNDKLIFDNAADFVSSSGYVKTLTYTNGATYAGYYQGNVTLTALPQTPLNAGPVPNAPALGSYIQVQLVSVEGPTGGAFGFWDTGATTPTISLSSGETGTNMFRLTESDGSPGSDPYGHIHGRRLTATKPGIYTVGFKLFDTSTNGVGGGPIHTPSDVLKVYFQADVNILSLEPDVDHSHIRFSAPVGSNWQLEVSDSLGPHANWASVGASIAGDDYFHEVEDEHAVQGERYYRMRSVAP